jgi:hypothetical protein
MLVVITTHHLKSRGLTRLITSRSDTLFKKPATAGFFLIKILVLVVSVDYRCINSELLSITRAVQILFSVFTLFFSC